MSIRALVLFALATSSLAQQRNPVQWTLSPESATAPPGGTVALKLTAKMEPGWHIYALNTPSGGPTPTTVKVTPAVPAVSAIRMRSFHIGCMALP